MPGKPRMINGSLNFSRIKEPVDVPYLLETQKTSYEEFLQLNISPDDRMTKGLQEAFRSIFPIQAAGNPSSLEFIEYNLGTPKYSVRECIERGMTYAAPLKVKLQLIVRELNPETSEVEIIDIKEQETYMGEIPLMTDKGTFIINGAERVIVSQLHRSPGVSFSSSLHPSNKTIYSARLIPDRGAWVEFEVDTNNIMHVMIDRKRKLFATTFLRAFGFEYDEEIASEFFETETFHLDDFSKGSTKVGELEEYLGELFIEDITDPKLKEKIVSQGDKVTKKAIESLKSHKFKSAFISQAKHYEDRLGRIFAEDVIDKKTGEVLGECWERITTTFLMKCARSKVLQVRVLLVDSEESDVILSTINKDKTKTRDDALVEFFKRMRPGNPVSVTSGRRLFEDMFFSDKRYDLGPVGRYKIIRKFGGNEKEHGRLLERSDIINLMKYLIRLQRGEEEIDDIDHLGNRRVRSVGELLQNQIRIGLADMEKTARERMSIIPELENLLPQNLVNAKPVLVAVKDFFGRSQLSQFMDQTNPLAELTNKRRLSALGPGGLSRDRAGFEVRDVHYSHYGRICPIETPEGPNIGLISSLSTYACVNKYGFIESPYRKVRKGKVTEEIDFLTADVEDNYKIAQANAPLDDNGRFVLDQVFCRYKEDFPLLSPSEVEYMDVSPKQLVSVSASLIPFLEHDDANRALMGSNMQRQAVPLLITEKPLVGTGIEKRVAVDSGVCVLARHDGVVERIESREIWIKRSDGKKDVYILEKFIRSNQNTCLNQKPLVNEGDRVKKGDVIADGPAINDGHIALGKNILVAFMPWGGYNFEDAILISEKLVKKDTFTSIHIEEFEVDARDTKLGKEEITRDIPNVSEEALSKLDEDGLVHIGADVVAGDILVGKVSPKGETELSSEEKLLRAIFGEKAGDVRDASLRVPSGVEGTVIDIKVFSRKERGSRTDREDKARIEDIEKTHEKEINTLEEEFNENLRNILKQQLKKDVINFETGEVELSANGRITESAMVYINRCLRTGMLPVDGKCGTLVKKLYQKKVSRENRINDEAKNKTDRVKTGDELPPGVIKLVKVYVAIKRKISVGDKMAGRHGNKGVIAKILPEEDMPFLEDGTPIDIILNPLGVPSRMNIGQILETCAGWAAKILGLYLATPIFDGIQEAQIRELLEKAHLPISGQVTLYDGHTGEPFDSPVTVGYIYMMKLVHLVDDKMHARAIGPYSLVTQQPLGGKAQFGGQRFGEMEVWALEAYGSAFTLQEMLTVKSDDVTGRTRMYESIVKGRNLLAPGIPESFNVLVKELQGLGLNMELLTQDEIKEEEQGDEAKVEKEEELLFEDSESEKSLFSDE